MDKTAQTAILYDFYESLLTDKQRGIFSAYHFSDCSLHEVAETENTSRQAVFDIITRTEKKLMRYETALKLAEKHKARLEKIEKLAECAENLRERLNETEYNSLLIMIEDLRMSEIVED